jgi:hypothetical protein
MKDFQGTRGTSIMPKCPYCNTITINSSKEWNYCKNYYHVKMINCQNCGLSFKSYYHDGKFSHNIPKKPTIEKRITKYLQIHREATEEQIAVGLNEKITEIELSLKSMQREGIIYKNPSSKE